VWKPRRRRWREADEIEQIADTCTALALVLLPARHALADDPLHAFAGIERRVGILEDELHAAAESARLSA
jgi:hypothetical protein